MDNSRTISFESNYALRFHKYHYFSISLFSVFHWEKSFPNTGNHWFVFPLLQLKSKLIMLSLCKHVNWTNLLQSLHIGNCLFLVLQHTLCWKRADELCSSFWAIAQRRSEVIQVVAKERSNLGIPREVTFWIRTEWLVRAVTHLSEGKALSETGLHIAQTSLRQNILSRVPTITTYCF